MQSILFRKDRDSPVLQVCVPVTTHPVTGGILTFLNTVVQVTLGRWQLEYLTQRIGPHADGLVIHTFGARRMSPWHFPTVWLYCLAGLRKLISLMRRGAGYQVLLPQDGVFTAAFSGLAGKLAGVRVVCVDHGPMTWFTSRVYPLYRAERLDDLAKKHWTIRLPARLLFGLYRPSLYLLASISARVVDHFLVPGVAGDGVEEICQRLGIQQSRVTRFETMIDVDRHIVLSPALKAMMREQKGLAGDDIVIAIVCRLAPEKGLDIALESIEQSLSALSPELCARVRVIVAGDGPLRRELEEEIRKRGLSQTYLFWGEISPEEVVSLLCLSDIFLYTSTRGACFAMAVLEAMASGCAVVASTAPISNAHLLAEGRGIAVAPGDAKQTAMALVQLMSDLQLCRRTGDLARDYITVHHSPAMFRRTLLRATYWSALDEILDAGWKKD